MLKLLTADWCYTVRQQVLPHTQLSCKVLCSQDSSAASQTSDTLSGQLPICPARLQILLVAAFNICTRGSEQFLVLYRS